MMILELDIGNTRIKWRKVSNCNSEIIADGTFMDEGEFISEQADSDKPDVFRFCNVRDKHVTSRIINWSQTKWDLKPVVATVRRECGGVKINYLDVSCLGADRWLAMLSAFEKSKGACIVVDSGTAFTLDVIGQDGMHLGGYILPGLDLMKESLVANTGICVEGNAIERSLELGNSTAEAVLNGSLATLVALIEKNITRLRFLGSEPTVFFSGGDAKVLAPLTDFAALRVELTLVLDGLAIACNSVD